MWNYNNLNKFYCKNIISITNVFILTGSSYTVNVRSEWIHICSCYLGKYLGPLWRVCNLQFSVILGFTNYNLRQFVRQSVSPSGSKNPQIVWNHLFLNPSFFSRLLSFSAYVTLPLASVCCVGTFWRSDIISFHPTLPCTMYLRFVWCWFWSLEPSRVIWGTLNVGTIHIWKLKLVLWKKYLFLNFFLFKWTTRFSFTFVPWSHSCQNFSFNWQKVLKKITYFFYIEYRSFFHAIAYLLHCSMRVGHWVTELVTNLENQSYLKKIFSKDL